MKVLPFYKHNQKGKEYISNRVDHLSPRIIHEHTLIKWLSRMRWSWINKAEQVRRSDEVPHRQDEGFSFRRGQNFPLNVDCKGRPSGESRFDVSCYQLGKGVYRSGAL